jgi:hypothetical protein
MLVISDYVRGGQGRQKPRDVRGTISDQIDWNIAKIRGPSPNTPAETSSATVVANSPYSIDVTPRSSPRSDAGSCAPKCFFMSAPSAHGASPAHVSHGRPEHVTSEAFGWKWP